MAELTQKQLKEWVESFKDPQMSSVEDVLEAQREAQGAAELAARASKGAEKPLSQLGEIIKDVQGIKVKPPLTKTQTEELVKGVSKGPKLKSAAESAKILFPSQSPAQLSSIAFEEAGSSLPKNVVEDIVARQSRLGKTAEQSAKVFEEAGSALPKNVAEDIVGKQSRLGKSAAESAKVFEKGISPAAESAKVFEEAGSALPKNIAEDIVEGASKGGKNARREAAKAALSQVKELPALSNYATSAEKKQFDALLKQAAAEVGSAGEEAIELGDAIKTTGRTISETPIQKSRLAGFLGKAAKPLAALSAAKDVYDVGTSLKEGDYRQAAEQAGSALGGLGGGALGTLAGPAGTVGGSIAGSYAGGKAAGALYDAAGNYLGDSEQGSSLVDSFLLMPETARKREQERKINEPIRRLEALRDTAKTAEERGYLEQAIKSTKQKMAGVSDEDVLAGEEAKQRELLSYKRPESVEKQEQFLKDKDEQIADFIASAESNRDYNAVNKSSGAFGKYQILEKDLNGNDVHGKAVEDRYGMSFKEAMADPAKQEDYFRNVLLPIYKKDAAKLAKNPKAQEMGLDEFTLTGMMQLGKGNVVNYLFGNTNENISNQMEYFKRKADRYKKEIGAEQTDLAALKDREAQMQEEGKYIPFKSAQAKMDTLRSGETTMTREKADALNQASKMREQDDMQRSASFIPFKSAEDKMRTLEEQQAVQEKEPEAGGYVQQPDEVASVKEQQAAKPKSRLEEALELQNRMEMLSSLSRSSELLGRGIGSAITKMAPTKMTGGEFEETLSKLGKQKVEGAKLLDEEEIKKEESDPTSNKSIRARESLSSVLGRDIPESMSYSDIKNLKLSDISLKTSAAESKSSAGETKLLTDAGKEIRKRSESVVKIMDLQKRAKDALKSPNAAKDIETLYGFIKSLDENSAVREGELKLAEGTLSRLSFYKNKLQGLVGSKRTLDDETLSNISKIMDEVSSQTQSNYGNYKKSIFVPLADKGISSERYEALDPISYRTQAAPSTEKQLSTKKLAKGKEREPGTTVTMSGVKYKIGEDGRELIPLK